MRDLALKSCTHCKQILPLSDLSKILRGATLEI